MEINLLEDSFRIRLYLRMECVVYLRIVCKSCNTYTEVWCGSIQAFSYFLTDKVAIVKLVELK